MPNREYIFAIMMGLTDGILTALTLASGRILYSPETANISLAIRVAVASSLSGLFIFFVAQYTRLRGELVRSEKELNLTPKGQLAATRLGRAILMETLRGAFISSIFTLLGAFLPLASGLLFPTFSWLTIVFAVGSLGFLGGAASRFAHGNPVVWSTGLVLMGILLTIAGIQLQIT
ncbi:MAG: hypothetical protein NWE98_08350 [Candidatus Bathyarchaeota archaeon]|nr:hypothetical protein [Candidatus Bathyarchaeota archaeon]